MEHLNPRVVLMVSIIAVTLAGCGGGDGGSTSNTGDNNGVGGVSDGGGGSGDTGSSAGARVSAKRYDLDNNGAFEGVENYTYDAGGRLVSKDSIYTGDGEPDHDFNSIVLFGVDGATERSRTEYLHDADGNVILEVTTYPVTTEGSLGAFVQRIEKDLTWTDGRVTRVRTRFFDPTGAVATTSTEQITYDSEGRLSTITNTTDGIEQNIVSYAYDGDANLPASYEISDTSITELTWSSDGLLTETNVYYTFTDPNEHHTKETKSYDDSGRLVESVLTYPGSPSDDDDLPYSWSVTYEGSSWKQIREQVDEQLDGAPESVIVTEYEEGACEATFTFIQRATFLGGEDDTPYQPGVGYYPLNGCFAE